MGVEGLHTHIGNCLEAVISDRKLGLLSELTGRPEYSHKFFSLPIVRNDTTRRPMLGRYSMLHPIQPRRTGLSSLLTHALRSTGAAVRSAVLVAVASVCSGVLSSAGGKHTAAMVPSRAIRYAAIVSCAHSQAMSTGVFAASREEMSSLVNRNTRLRYSELQI